MPVPVPHCCAALPSMHACMQVIAPLVLQQLVQDGMAELADEAFHEAPDEGA